MKIIRIGDSSLVVTATWKWWGLSCLFGTPLGMGWTAIVQIGPVGVTWYLRDPILGPK